MTTLKINTAYLFQKLCSPTLLAFFLHYFLFLPAGAIAQAGALPQVLDLPFDHLTIEDGLPHPSVLDIMQDDQGFLWIATLRGIVRYDGYEMTTYFPAAVDPDSLPVRDLPRLYQDRSGGIWVGLIFQDARLFKYDPTIDEFVPYLYDAERGIEVIKDHVVAMHEDREGNLLVAVDGQGLLVVDIKKEKEGVAPAELPYRLYQSADGHPDSLASNFLGRSIVEDDRGHYWLPTEAGLCEFFPEEGRFQTHRFTADTTAGANVCNVLYKDRSGRLWVGIKSNAIYEFDLQNRKFDRSFRYQPADPYNTVLNDFVGGIVQDQKGQFWVIGSQYLYQFHPSTGRFNLVRDLPRPGEARRYLGSLTTLYVGPSGNIWTGAWNSGISVFNPDRAAFRFFNIPSNNTEEVKRPWVWSLAESENGIIWLCTSGGKLLRWDRRKNEVIEVAFQPDIRPGRPAKEITHLAMGVRDYLWISTRQGLHRLHLPSGQVTHFLGDNFIFQESITGSDGSIWWGKWGKGLYRLMDEETGRLVLYREIRGIWTMEEDENRHVWLGINQEGLVHFDPERDTFEFFIPKYGVRDIHFDQQDQCWLATHSAGLKLFDRESGEVVHLAPETHDRIGMVQTIQGDDRGHLWLMTPDGLTEFDPETRKVLRQFPYRYWMSKEAPWFTGHEGFRLSTGEPFFPSPSGILYFHPDSIRTDSLPPQVSLTSFSLSGDRLRPGPGQILPRHISYLDHLTLRHDQNDIDISYAALHFKSPEENRYRYFLENFDEEWHEAGKQRTATYTNLPPGEYTFRVQAANSDGVWNREGTSLHITVLPPWHQTVWARLLFVLTGLAFIYFGYRFLLSRQAARAEAFRLRELDAFKTRFYHNITHEFRTPLTLILGQTEALQQQSTTLEQKRLTLIQRYGRQILRLINQLLDLSKLESGYLSLNPVQMDTIPFLRGLTAAFTSAAEEQGLDLHFETEAEELFMYTDPEKVQIVVDNLLSNALKFTPRGGKVRVTVRTEQRKGSEERLLQLTVRDSGPGIAPEHLSRIFNRFYQASSGTIHEGTGIGLALTKELVQLMGGRIEVDSQLGGGTEFRVFLPIRQTGEQQRKEPVITPMGWETPTREEKKPAPLFPSPEAVEHPLVLIVEDNADMAKFIADVLGDQYRIQIAVDGVEGIRKALDLSPDLLISDVMMPKVDGFELCRTLKADERTSHIPIILLTARADQKDRLTGLSRGADAYLAKPFDRRELLIRLEQLTALRHKLQERYGQLATLSWEEEFSNPEANFMRKVRRQILDHLDDPGFNIHILYGALNMSRTTLYQKLKALTGRSPTLYIRAVRLYEGRKLLLETSLSVAEVAYRVGFSDPNYFSTCFKDEFQITPSEIRIKEK